MSGAGNQELDTDSFKQQEARRASCINDQALLISHFPEPLASCHHIRWHEAERAQKSFCDLFELI